MNVKPKNSTIINPHPPMIPKVPIIEFKLSFFCFDLNNPIEVKIIPIMPNGKKLYKNPFKKICLEILTVFLSTRKINNITKGKMKDPTA